MQPNDPNNIYTTTNQPPVTPGQIPGQLSQPGIAAPAFSTVQQTTADTVRPKGRKVILASVAFAVVAAVAVGGYFGYGSVNKTKANDAARAFVLAVNAGDNTKAYQSSSANVQKDNTQAQFTAAMAGLQTASPKFVSHDLQINGSVATYTAVETNLPADQSGSTKATFKLGLQRSGIDWKVDSVSVE